MQISLVTVALERENDLLLARQRARQITQLLGFTTGDCTRVTTAVAEIARNALVYGGGGTLEFLLDVVPQGSQAIVVHVTDAGAGIANLDTILSGKYGSHTGMGVGITGSRALMDHFHIETVVGDGTRVRMSKLLPRAAPRLGPAEIARLVDALVMRGDGTPFGELQLQTVELMRALKELTERQADVERLSLLAEEARERAEAAQLAAERSQVVQERFMALTTHEIRTPLNAMIGYLDLLELELEGELNERQAVYLLRARRACKHLMGVTNDFLDMAMGDAGQLQVARDSGPARHAINEALALVAPQAASRTVEIAIVELAEHLTYLGDADRVRQVLVNVLGNAVSFTPPGGAIRVTVSRVDVCAASSVLVGGPWCAICIADSGPGIAADAVSRVFEPFVQVALASEPGRRGSGLGLTVSRQLALLMGGDLTAEGSAGIDGGAAFTLWLADGTAVSPDVALAAS